MVNRAALILKYKEPAVRWINEVDPCPDAPPITIEETNGERNVYLISDDDADTSEDVKRWVRRNFRALFDTELEGWYTDPGLWPANRTLKMFNEWFDVECHTVLIDTVGGPIFDDEIE